MKQYIEFNMAKRSSETIEYVYKIGANIMETIIFIFMGITTVSDQHSWNTGFVLITIAACTIYRIIGVIIFANLANRWRLIELKATDMLIMSYGGIRGAVAFALALILDESKIPRKKEFVTATIAVVFFTIFLQVTKVYSTVFLSFLKRECDCTINVFPTLQMRMKHCIF
jgi:sodium/hydrogen exchanger-like protein 3